ncbi:MAG: Sensor protein CpxA [bacterium ADurb.Bin243]|nr:MAG: Sensor protein CpxA [bacterium ADurb.Bin243]
MKKISIFIKIYLSFWLFTVLIVLSQFAFDWLTQSGPFRGPFHGFHDRILTAYASEVIERHSGMQKSASDKDEKKGEIFVVDEALYEISGKNLDEGQKKIASAAFKSKKPERYDFEGQKLFARSITGPDGKLYAVVHLEKPGEFPQPGNEIQRMIMRILIIILISAGVCYLLAAYISSPIFALREAAQRFSEGELDYRTGGAMAGRKDEFSQLAEAFDRMAERIENLMTQQRQLLADVSHELRSPLARLGVALEIARKQSGEAAEKPLNRIAHEAQTLNALIGDVLSLTRLESGIKIPASEPFCLGALIKKLSADADFEAQGGGKKVTIKEFEEITVRGDEELIMRAVENVIRNAVKYAPEKTEIEVSLKKLTKDSAGFAQITVRDAGRGVPESELENIFTPFYRVSNARERQSGGSGLGLAITRRAVLLHSGTVDARNAVNGGLIVTITLPAENV